MDACSGTFRHVATGFVRASGVFESAVTMHWSYSPSVEQSYVEMLFESIHTAQVGIKGIKSVKDDPPAEFCPRASHESSEIIMKRYNGMLTRFETCCRSGIPYVQIHDYPSRPRLFPPILSATHEACFFSRGMSN